MTEGKTRRDKEEPKKKKRNAEEATKKEVDDARLELATPSGE